MNGLGLVTFCNDNMTRQHACRTKYFEAEDGVPMKTTYCVLCTPDSAIPPDWQPCSYAASEINHAADKFKEWVRRSFYLDDILYASPPPHAKLPNTRPTDDLHRTERYKWVDENRFVHEVETMIDHIRKDQDHEEPWYHEEFEYFDHSYCDEER